MTPAAPTHAHHRTDHGGHHHQQTDHLPHHCRRHPSPLLARLPPSGLRRLRPHHLHSLQQGRTRCRHQSLPPRRRLRRRRPRQDGTRASLPGGLLLRRYFSCRHPHSMAGCPYYAVRLGRKDGLTSKASTVDGKLPTPQMPMSQIIGIFKSRGFSVQELVALSGAHTIGFSHCKEFSSNIYNHSRTIQSDPTYNPRFAAALRNACADYGKNPTLSVFNDIMTPNKFDNMYYQNLPEGLGLLSSDRAMYSDAATRPYVERYAKDQNAFFKAFGEAMVKLSESGVLTGLQGEIRRRCDAFN